MQAKPTPPYESYQVVDSKGINLRASLLPYLNRWPWYVVSLVLAFAGAYVYLLFKQPIYRSELSLLLQDEKKGNVQANPLKELDVYTSKKAVENEIEVLTSSSLMGQVVDALQLQAKYFHQTSFGKREIFEESPVTVLVEKPKNTLYKKPLELSFLNNKQVNIDGKVYPLNASIQLPTGQIRVLTRQAVNAQTEPLSVQLLPRNAAVKGYLGNLKAEATSKTSSVVHLKLEDAVPEKADAILNNLAKAYNDRTVADKNRVATQTIQLIEDRLRTVSGDLSSVEKRVEQYKSARSITDLGTQASTFLESTQQNDNLLNQVNIQLATLNDLQKFISTQSDEQGLTPATVGLNDVVLLGQIDKLSQLQLQRQQLSQTTTESNYMIKGIDDQIRSTRQNISQNVQTMKSMLLNTQKQYEQKNARLENSIRDIPQQERLLIDITRQQSIKNNLYNYLLQKREEMAVAFAASIPENHTIDPAESGATPVKPVGIVMYALFGLIGFLVPTAAIAGKGALNGRVMRRVDVEGVTRVPILGEIMKKREKDQLVIAQHSKSIIAEQIRTIRTNLHLRRGDMDESHVLLFTSSISGEGKSFISMNLGASLALMKQPTVILEMDMRMPRIHQVFDVENDIGISDYLNEEASLEEILRPVPGYPNYFVIPSGPLPPNPSELLSGHRLPQLLQELRERFSYIIVDAPPVGIVTDAQLVSPMADATLFVIRHGVTPKAALKELDVLHRERRFNNLNIILNGVAGGDSYHYNYKNSYSYK
ncbi:capsular biosynthesis protein [Siphonobacter sp. BAB-5385]|uniref:GumC family protein n=1 Tax=Siphonobacter sp. BAB-5385 TaxID=1864822 RepID=UPI000B9E389B|nr:tyrosine-protein kinase family protein [Siphonobacter sp. BAB-5385]OZI07351.1 capsular biosynthesis protein [Siphonobacter sp. BAB-5385]